MKLIVGLGNHGQEYAYTRHNIGWDAVTLLGQKNGVKFQTKSRFQAEIAELSINSEKILLVRPLTYMNRSGEALKAVMSFYKVDLSQVLIVHDEMDYALGKQAFCAQAGPAGHNGIRSIQEQLGTEQGARLRLGIGRPTGQLPKEEFVLQRFSGEEQPIVEKILSSSVNAMEDWIKHGTEKAMNIWNAVRP
ncbi:aminoacyl-tRNA hydrolase [Patescibacteria group bacterium]|nr:aminoacyl-tRNA hydrolase [Patescibacteria group bacterium]MBP9709798.1 aminoacyl-tRNA hydrolase [Patescibacteria group bacterium]